MAERPALEAVGLLKRYGERTAVHGVDLRLRAGEVHGLLGANGAGKTTLIRLLLGLVRLDAGSVRLLGQDVDARVGSLPEGVAAVIDPPCFYPYLSAARNLELLARLDDAPRVPDAGRGGPDAVADLLEQVGLASHARTKVGAYSAGMRLRLGIAAALLRRPRLLLLDEPTSSLDPSAARDVRAQVRRLAKGGTAVLLSSHDLVEVRELCTTVTVLRRGRTAYQGSIESLLDRGPDSEHHLSTGDDPRALAMHAELPGVRVTGAASGLGLDVAASEEALDGYTLALGRAGIPIRSLVKRELGLESFFLRLASDAPDPALPGTPAVVAPSPSPVRARASRWDVAAARGAWAAFVVECVKLAAQIKPAAVLAACLLSPFAFVAALGAQGTLPEDTLFGRWVTTSGFAVPLVVLGFAGAWALPVLASIVSGDLFSEEDRHHTWTTLLTRSRTRRDLFVGKVMAAFLFVLVALAVLAASSLAAGALGVGRQPLLGLSGLSIAPGRSLVLVAAAWASVAPPALGFAALASFLSVLTRSGVTGVVVPVLVGFAMELLSYVPSADAARSVSLTAAFGGWHGLFTEPRFTGALGQGMTAAGGYAALCLVGAWVVMRRRDIGA